MTASSTIRTADSVRAYEICYLDAAGRVIASHNVQCSGEKQARILAHALRPEGMRRLEVWRCGSLVYERPQTRRPAAWPMLPDLRHNLPPLAAE